MISRNWSCHGCRHQFHSYERNPECPQCGCVRVGWVPTSVHTRKMEGVDKTARQLADSYGMSDINTASPSRLNRAMPAVQQPATAGQMVANFAPGFSAPIDMATGAVTCGPSMANVDFKAKVATGKPIVGAPGNPRITAGTSGAAVAIARGGYRPAVEP